MIFQMIALFFVGLAANFIGTLVGGGGLITLPFLLIFNIPVQMGIGTNKFSSGIAAFSNVIHILKNKSVAAKMVLITAVMGFLGGMTGGLITANIDEKVLNVLVILLLIFALVVTLKNKPAAEASNFEDTGESTLLQKVLTYLIGLYDGGFGPGSSTLGIMMFMRERMSYVRSVHLTRILIFGSNIGALIIYLNTGFFNWAFALPLALGSIVGAQIGFLVLEKIPQKVARVILMIVTVLLIIQIGLRVI